METIQNYDQIPAVLSLASTAVGEFWAVYPGMRYGVTVLAGLTAVYTADIQPFYQSGQIKGILGGLKGAAEYETARGPPRERHGRDALPEGRPLHDHPLHRPREHRLSRHSREEPLMDATAGSVAWTLVGGVVTLGDLLLPLQGQPALQAGRARRRRRLRRLHRGELLLQRLQAEGVGQRPAQRAVRLPDPLHPRPAPLQPIRAEVGLGEPLVARLSARSGLGHEHPGDAREPRPPADRGHDGEPGRPGLRATPGRTILQTLVSIFLVVGTIACLVFFLFSVEHKGSVGRLAYFGRLCIMAGFGASFGYTVMARVSLLIGRIQFLTRDWWKAIGQVFS